ncbi:MAG: hypothetical protein WAZ98_11955 [Cyclobacteriaceae bacterium]
MKLDKILNEISKLSYEERKFLLRELSDSLVHEKSVQVRKITELKGLGKEIWKGIDVEEYIKNERNWN